MHLARSRLSANNNLTSKGPSRPSGRVQGNQGNVTWKSGSVASPLCCSSTFRKITAMASLVQFSNGMVQIVVSEKKSHGGDPFVILFSFSYSSTFSIYDSPQWYPRMCITPKYSDDCLSLTRKEFNGKNYTNEEICFVFVFLPCDRYSYA